jgi:plastocyanin
MAALALLAPAPVAGSATISQVVIKDVAFTPAEVSVHAGDVLEWINQDAFVHTATATKRQFRVVVEPGRSQRVVFKQAGTIEYFCEYHPTMKGQVVVAAEGRGAPDGLDRQRPAGARQVWLFPARPASLPQP